MEKSKIEGAWELMTSKGLTFGERLDVRNAFIKFGRDTKDSSKVREDNGIFCHEDVRNYGFSSEKEAIFVANLMVYLPEGTSTESVVNCLNIINTLYGVNSEYKFRTK